jgi:predicted DNA-binding transcriptional regulator YafY
VTKIERIFKVLSMLAQDNEATIDVISDALSVSKRTVYRDLRIIKQIGMTLGEQLYLSNRISQQRFTNLEIRMLKFALSTHPLASLFPFEELSNRLEDLS